MIFLQNITCVAIFSNMAAYDNFLHNQPHMKLYFSISKYIKIKLLSISTKKTKSFLFV